MSARSERSFPVSTCLPKESLRNLVQGKFSDRRNSCEFLLFGGFDHFYIALLHVNISVGNPVGNPLNIPRKAVKEFN